MTLAQVQFELADPDAPDPSIELREIRRRQSLSDALLDRLCTIRQMRPGQLAGSGAEQVAAWMAELTGQKADAVSLAPLLAQWAMKRIKP